MEKQEVKSRWDELAREIGAEISPDREQLVDAGPPPPAVETPAQAAPKPRAATHPPAPKRPTAGWDNLANEFGLPTPQPVAEPIIEEVAAVTEQVIVSRVADVEKPPRERDSSERPPRERQERSGRRREPPSRDRDEGRPREHQDARRGSAREKRSERRPAPSAQRRQQREPRYEREERQEPGDRHRRAERQETDERREREEQQEREQRAEREELADREHHDESIKPAPAVSLWQKIFGAPAAPADAAQESSSLESARTPSELDEEQRILDDAEFRGPRFRDDEPRADDRSEGQADSEFGGLAEQPQSTEHRQPRPRRRRRGRGGKGERSADAKSAEHHRRKPTREDDSADEDDDLDDLSGVDDELEMEGPGELASVADDSRDGDSDQSASARSRTALQRSIPSWEEAIGFIVDTNMQARSQRRPSSGSRSGPSRGRPPRGRRKK